MSDRPSPSGRPHPTLVPSGGWGDPELWQRVRVFLEMIKFSHSVFALPFALIAMLVAAGGLPRFWTLFWIVVAVVSARTAAMCFNRIVDRDLDARNPRTRTRALVTGELSIPFAWQALFVSSIVFFVSAAFLNKLAFYLSPPCLAVLLGYSYTKRFTPFSHVVLGVALGLAPIGAWIAVTGALSWTPVLLGVGVMLWVAGFDILYSCQDYEHDRREEGLHSIPKWLGIERSLLLSKRFHAAATIAFFGFGFSAAPPLGALFLLGVATAGGLMVREHSLVAPDDLSRLNAAFFTMNGMISVGLLLFAAADLFFL